ncbi:hypothetical protein JTB14_022932 [Gonioctena quinquepunctata]|nr:hypothetical protein JTB14_022932 [Gonioctena quinquepunctata]
MADKYEVLPLNEMNQQGQNTSIAPHVDGNEKPCTKQPSPGNKQFPQKTDLDKTQLEEEKNEKSEDILLCCSMCECCVEILTCLLECCELAIAILSFLYGCKRNWILLSGLHSL